MKIVFATNNEHKLSEIRDILGDKMEVLSLNDIGCHVDIPETGQTLEENALQKAQYVYDHYGYNVFSDDTGLEVDALGGAPGVHTARYAGGEGHDAEANTRKLLYELRDQDNRKARFRTAIALICNKEVNYFEGIVEGEITREKRGEKGFGYDPVFKPDGYDGTFAELGVEVKNQISHRARAVQKLVKYLSSVMCCLLALLPINVNAQTGTWHNYLAYYDVQDICKAENDLYVLASNALYSYNLTDQSITTYDKVNGLSDTYITHIKWNPTAKRLIIVYQDQNIDMMEEGGGVINLSDFYHKAMTGDKTVNSIYIHEQYAYLCCGFGIVKIDMDRIEISESYILNKNITQVVISGGNIYAKQKNGQVLTASTSANLLDPANWNQTTTYDNSIFNIDRTDYNQYIEIVKTLNPGGPKYNYFGFMKFQNNRLYTCNGSIASRKASVQIMENDEWTIFQEDGINASTGLRYEDLVCLEIDPSDPNHVFAGGRNGLYEYQDAQFKAFYNHKNSPIESAFVPINEEYEMITGLLYENNGNLIVMNSESQTHCVLDYSSQGSWSTHNHPILMKYEGIGMPNLSKLMIDSRGLIWFVNNNWLYPALYVYDRESDQIIEYHTFINQDGTKLDNMYAVTCVVEDNEGNMWVGTDVGLLMIEKKNIGKSESEMVFTQVKVPRNDGTNYADYLLSGLSITSIMVDNDNQKWVGTEGNGLYVISSDCMTEMHHFTSDNSYLLSNIILSIAMNEKTGEVYIGTENGLCSYMSGVIGTITEMTEDEVYAYPNPVTPEYTGMITITGLTNDASVKILSSNGTVIAEGKSTGRTFMWNGRDKNGDRVASGMYMVATATSDGKKGVVCKIAVIN